MCPRSAEAGRPGICLDSRPGDSSSNASQPATASPECVPKDELSQAAYAYARKQLDPTILNHSLRVYLLAHGLGSREKSPLVSDEHRHLLFAACVLHDIGTTEAHNGDQRFEVEGADAAATLVKDRGASDAEIQDVWTAVAVHTTPGIAERISPLARLVRMGVAMDFKRPAALRLGVEEEIEDVERTYPRGEIEKVLGDAVVRLVFLKCEQAREGGKDPDEVERMKAPAATWPGGLVRSAKENPGWSGVNRAF